MSIYGVKGLTLFHTILCFTTLKKKSFENIVEQGENAGNRHFLLSPHVFYLFSKQILIFQSHLVCKCLQFEPVWKFVAW